MVFNIHMIEYFILAFLVKICKDINEFTNTVINNITIKYNTIKMF